MDSVKFIVLLAIAFAVVTQSGCLSQRAARYAIRHGSAAVKSRAEARRESRAAMEAREIRDSRDNRDSREDYRTDSRDVPMTSREYERENLR